MQKKSIDLLIKYIYFIKFKLSLKYMQFNSEFYFINLLKSNVYDIEAPIPK